MNAKRILIVEDEQPIREMVIFSLTGAGFEVREAGDARQAQTRIAERLPDLILLDWMLPGISGIDFARRLKREELTRELPVIMLTARAEEEDTVQGLESGADDYIIKPFSPRELVARIRAVLRRGGPAAEDEMLRANGLSVDLASHRVSAGETLLDTRCRLPVFDQSLNVVAILVGVMPALGPDRFGSGAAWVVCRTRSAGAVDRGCGLLGLAVVATVSI